MEGEQCALSKINRLSWVKTGKKVKNNLEICIKFVIKIYEPFDSVNSTPRNLTQINHHYRYKDKIRIMFEILSKEAKKKGRT